MDKATFISHAETYYALAVGAELLKRVGAITESQIQYKYSYVDEFEHVEDDRVYLLDNKFLWERAIGWLQEKQLIAIRKAPFGPALYAKTKDFDVRWLALTNEIEAIDVFNDVADKDAWLTQALSELLQTYRSLGITGDDFDNAPDEWAPIALDTASPAFEQAVEKLNQAVAEIRADNGYAATYPEEREFVVTGLSQGVEKLKTGTVSANYIRDLWEKLSIVGRRFSGAALELVTLGAKQAIVELIKQQGGELLRHLLRLIAGG